MTLPFRGNGQGIGGPPGPVILSRPHEAAAGLAEGHHRLDHGGHIALKEELGPGRQGRGDRAQQGRLQHPPFAVPELEPGVGELDRDALQQATRQPGQPALQAHVGVAEQKVQVGEARSDPLRLGCLHQGPADLHAQMVVVALQGRQVQQEATTGAADVEHKGLIRMGE